MRLALGLALTVVGCTAPAVDEEARALGGVPPSCPATIFGDAVPRDLRPDTSPVEVGVKLRTRGTTSITGVRFYKGSANTGTHVGWLWSESGALLAMATFTGEGPSGWQTARFPSPVVADPNLTYVASVSMPNGGFAGDLFGMEERHGDPDGPVYSLASGETPGGNGVYRHGFGGLPTRSYLATNYYVDVTATDGDLPAPPLGLAASRATATLVELSWTSLPVDRGRGITTPVARQVVTRDGLDIASLPADTLTYTDVLVAPGTVYTYAVRGEDHCGNRSGAPSIEVRTPAAATSTSGQTLFGDAPPPGAVTHPDPAPVEVGVKVRPYAGGAISEVHFYRATDSGAGTVVNLWSEGGVRLATAPWTGGAVPGWQRVRFASPVPVVAGATYIASYHAPAGRFSYTYQGLVTPVVRGDLATAPGGSAYVYAPASRFPSASYASTNYWVDVRFEAESGAPATADLFGRTAPAAAVAVNAQPLTVGVKLRSSVATQVHAIRIYRPVPEPVVAVSLFSEDGVRLGSSLAGADPGGAPGWREVRLSRPVSLAADTTYVAAAAIGGTSFSYTAGGLATERVSGSLRALPSGLYVYSTDPHAFPRQSFLESNYWVDVIVSAPPAPPPGQTLFDATDPEAASSNAGGDPVVVGVKLRADVAGEIRAVRFYRAGGTPACCAVALWLPPDILIASAPSPVAAAPGWHEVAFATPVPINAGWVYVASYHATDGAFSYQLGGMAGGITRGNLRALSSAEAVGNGVFAYSATHVVPARSWVATQYYVDVVFTPATR